MTILQVILKINLSQYYVAMKTNPKILITSAYSDPEPISTFLKYVELDRFKNFVLTDSAEEASIILFVENSRYQSDYFFSKLKKNSIIKKYPDKTYMYNAHDLPWLVIPGLYTCIPSQQFDQTAMIASPYIEVINSLIRYDAFENPQYLFSFYGALSSKPRYKVADLNHPRGIIKISNKGMYVTNKPQDLQIEYANLLSNSKFVLCPKGIGTSSARLFETMQAGRVPVIISDNWVRPKGPNWEDIAIFVPENQVEQIPAILEREEANWNIKSALVRKAWEDYFAPDAVFNYFAESLLRLNLEHKKQYYSPMLKVNNYLALIKYGIRKLIWQNIKPLFRFPKNE
jgi:hypothetical protein